MLNHLLFFLLFETAQPSYGLFAASIPQEIVVASQSTAVVKRSKSIAPVVQARSIYSIDLDSGTPLLVRDIFERRPIASIAKLVTAMVILDNHMLDEVVTVSKNAANQEGSEMGLIAGERMTVENMLTGMLINSGNDAAVALAEFDAATEADFADKLNKKAQDLLLQNSHFSNAKGFDEEDNYSTAFDTMQFAKAALTYPKIRKVVAIKNGEIKNLAGTITHKLISTNELLEDSHFHVIGLKTGNTPSAGQSFVSLLITPHNHEVLTVMLDSPNRFKETKIVLDWILRNYDL